jgi:hypothetical protein
MKSINESLYYFTTSTETGKFGLLHPRQNKFYLVDNRYEVIKLVQLLLCKYQHFSIVNLLKIHGGSAKIDNDKCHLIGCSTPAIKNFHIDVSTRRTNIKLTSSTTPIDVFDLELQEKIFFLRQFINFILNVVEDFKKEETSHIEDAVSGLVEFKKFINIVLPNDTTAVEFADTEIVIKKQNLIEIDQLYKDIIVILNQINFLKHSIEEIKLQIINNINKLPNNNQVVKVLKSAIIGKIK